MILSIDALREKRKKRWFDTKDINLDKAIVNAIADKIFETPAILEEIKKKPYLLIECCFSIVDKEKNYVPFFFNDVQKDFINQMERYGTKKPYFILKGRQQGFTTLITAIGLCFAITRKNFSGFTLADRDDNTKAIFTDKAKVMYNALPERLKPTEKFNSVNELYFDKLNSSWRVASASSNVGRSRTLSFIHFVISKDGIKYVQNIYRHTFTGEEDFFKVGENCFEVYLKPQNRLCPVLCTHYAEISANTDASLRIKDLQFNTASDFKDYVKEQFDSGTPIIAEYVLESSCEADITDYVGDFAEFIKTTYGAGEKIYVKGCMPPSEVFCRYYSLEQN